MGQLRTAETEATALIGIDWGTSQLRAYRIGSEGNALDHRKSNLGIAAIRNGEFDSVLQALIGDWRQKRTERTPVILCGMIGSRQGWREVSYQPCPANVRDLAGALDIIDTSDGPAWIVGGLSADDGYGMRDIMRGEETQIFGAIRHTGRQIVVAPGTHSKWAIVHDGTIESFRTYMTGEIYALLCRDSTLSWLMDGTDGDDERAFLNGVQHVLRDPDLLHSLFSVRTKGLFEQQSQAGLASYLSGILIGSEVRSAAQCAPTDPVVIIARPMLGRLYKMALSMVGFSDIQHVDGGEAAVQGLWKLWQLGKGKERA